jgi:hypothetical protein
MTKRTSRIVAAVTLAVLTLAGLNSFAQTVQFNGAGSSAMFQTFALAAYASNSCGTNIWTKKSGASGIDSRRGDIPAQTGNVWIVWNNNKTVVCAYLSVDSIVGNILFFAVPRATLSIPATEVGTTGDNLIPTLTDVPLDQTVYNELNNVAFNAAMSDIRPEDALFAVNRALAPLDPNYNGLGYTGDGLVGVPIVSSQSSASATPVAFALTGKDPISGGNVPNWAATNVGANPVVVFVNTQNTSSGHFGSSAFVDVSRFALTGMLNGTLTRTRDITNVPGLPSVGAHVFLREPISGTYNTLEFNIPRSLEIGSTQELGVDPNQPDGNPLNITYPTGGTRERVIGTGQMTSTVGATTDSLGYAFWGTGNFAKVLTTTKYLSVDGVDPLNYSWYQSHGNFPNCVIPCKGLIPFVNILNGSYPAWTILRVATASPVPTGVAKLITASNKEAQVAPDYVPYKSLTMFRSHFDRAGEAHSASNGNAGEPAEAGGDEGGAVFPINADNDYFADTGLQLLGMKQ